MGHYQILIIGGGTAGITVAAQLRIKDKSLQVAILEPSKKPLPACVDIGRGGNIRF